MSGQKRVPTKQPVISAGDDEEEELLMPSLNPILKAELKENKYGTPSAGQGLISLLKENELAIQQDSGQKIIVKKDLPSQSQNSANYPPTLNSPSQNSDLPNKNSQPNKPYRPIFNA